MNSFFIYENSIDGLEHYIYTYQSIYKHAVFANKISACLSDQSIFRLCQLNTGELIVKTNCGGRYLIDDLLCGFVSPWLCTTDPNGEVVNTPLTILQ